MAELLGIFAGLLSIAAVPLAGYSVVRLGRRSARRAALFLAAVLLAGVAAIAISARDGFAYDQAAGRVVFGTESGRRWFGLGLVLLSLDLPAWVLLLISRAKNGEATGPVGGQWIAVLFGYWMATLVGSAAIYGLLTGHIK